jgi:hypothetical protein
VATNEWEQTRKAFSLGLALCRDCGGSVRTPCLNIFVSMTDQDYRAVMSADVESLIRRSMTKGHQLFSLLTPPLYTAFVLARRGRSQFSLNRLLRATWIGGFAGTEAVDFLSQIFLADLQCEGSVGGGAIEWARSSSASAESVRGRRMHHAYNVLSHIFYP